MFSGKGRSAHEQNLFTALSNRFSSLVGINDELGNTVFLGRFDDIDQVMWNLTHLLGRRFRGSDVHSPINGHRIERDDFGVQPSGPIRSLLGFFPMRWGLKDTRRQGGAF